MFLDSVLTPSKLSSFAAVIPSGRTSLETRKLAAASAERSARTSPSEPHRRSSSNATIHCYSKGFGTPVEIIISAKH